MSKEMHCPERRESLVEETGFLPFFRNDIPGFPAGACIAPGNANLKNYRIEYETATLTPGLRI